MHLTALESEVKKRLVTSGIPAASVSCLDDLFDEGSPHMHPFSDVESPHQQLTFYRKHFELIVSGEGVWRVLDLFG